MRTQGVARALPVPVKRAGNAVLNAVDPVVRRRYGAAHPSVGPVPPRELRRHGGAPNLTTHLNDGEHVADELAAVLDNAGRSIDSFGSILDFGCGCGRVMRFVAARARPGATLLARDIDADSIAWLQSAFPSIDARRNEPLPPLGDLPDASVELVYAISVFTHVDAEYQDAWLAEIARVLAPGGLGVLTVMGEELVGRYVDGARPGITPAWQRRMRAHPPLAQVGLIHEPYESALLSSRRHGDPSDRYGMTFHATDYVREHWAQYLEVVDIAPQAMNWQQDAVVVRKHAG
jgi:SAM-dependent methyltransferase